MAVPLCPQPPLIEEDGDLCCTIAVFDIPLINLADNRRFFITGHPEYDPETLANEYFRDVNKGIDINVPDNYFPNDDPTQPPLVRWRSAAQLFYTNWLNYYVYQTTPYDIRDI